MLAAIEIDNGLIEGMVRLSNRMNDFLDKLLLGEQDANDEKEKQL